MKKCNRCEGNSFHYSDGHFVCKKCGDVELEERSKTPSAKNKWLWELPVWYESMKRFRNVL